jgi:hypothetical protein
VRLVARSPAPACGRRVLAALAGLAAAAAAVVPSAAPVARADRERPPSRAVDASAPPPGAPPPAAARARLGPPAPVPVAARPASIVDLDWPARLAPAFRAAAAPTPAAARVLEVLARVRARQRVHAYEHVTRVRERDGVYLWDCSGMVAWVLARAAPRALASLGAGRPLARDIHRAIARAPAHARGRGGWQRVPHLEDVRPGDVFAWLRPPDWPPRNTGHSGFVLAPPEPIPGWSGAYALRIGDATSVAHQDDTRAGDPDGGYGEGTIVFLTDGAGRGVAYAWHGTLSRAAVRTDVVFGRLAGR